MKILSWNILANEFIAKRHYPMVPADLIFKRSTRLQQIMSLLVEEDADVILLQEVMLSEYNALEQQFGRHYHLIKSKPIVWQGVRCHSYNVILLRKSLFLLRGNRVEFFDFGIMVECAYKKNSTSYLISNVHLDDLSQAVRLKQLEELSDKLLEGDNVILGGDFNENYGNKASIYTKVKSFGLKIMNDEPTYYIGRKMCIDNIMLKGSSKKEKVKVKVKVINEFENDVLQHFIHYGSDHLPVVVETR
jgi:endonuclease/exonuclease/phosphatase family metal-dependent hydrolase